MGRAGPALPAAGPAPQSPIGLWRAHCGGNSTGRWMGGAGQRHRDSTDGWLVDTGLARHRTACLALHPLPGMGSPLCLVGSQKPGG